LLLWARLTGDMNRLLYGGFAAVSPADRRYESIAVGPADQQQPRRSGQCHVAS